ncbi:5-methyltetrahydropteroyltriglutamate--homocysteine S-methyltransferase, partial [Pseudorhodoplanes sp.]|uniref:5-methyltetrahydropteroyltriglutamate-- homocysteine S-methyltransferase n=1 Tax=Pseudorhodoplanes sp. TaxID=1934341 RepID=UPI003D0A1D98
FIYSPIEKTHDREHAPMTTLPQGRPPFRADHVGSLLRPPVLRQAFRDHMGKRIDDAAFAKIQDACIRDVVKMQEDVGLQVVTDGEFRRGSYWGRFVERIDGFAIKSAVFKFRDDQGHQVDFTAPHAEGRLHRNKPLALDEFEFLQGITAATPKITLPAPSTMHFYRATDFAAKSAYSDVKSFFDDLNRIFREEIADLAKAGCKYIQLDEVAIALLCDPNIRQQVEAEGMKPDELVELYIDSINECVKGAPADVVFGVHMCRGNFKGHYLGAGGYESVAERFFEGTRVNHFLLEYDTERAGDFKPLRFVKGKGVVLGLISSKTPVLESLDVLKRRTEEATQYIDLDRLAISPQCGFASTVAGNPVTEADERRKLELEVEAARAIWG